MSPWFGGGFTVRSTTLTRRRLRGPAAHSPQTGGWREAGGYEPRFGGCFTVRSTTLTRRRLRRPAAHSPQTGGWREAG
jgi:hypothetical protein